MPESGNHGLLEEEKEILEDSELGLRDSKNLHSYDELQPGYHVWKRLLKEALAGVLPLDEDE